MKFKNKLLGLTLGLALTIGVGYSLANNQGQAKMASAEESTITISGSEFTAAAAGEVNQTVKDITFAITNGTFSNNQVRVYKSATLTISSNYLIKKMTITCTVNGTAKYGPGCLKGANYTASTSKTGVWELSSGAKEFSLTAESNQCRITKFEFTVDSSSLTDPNVKITSKFNNLEVGQKGTIECESLNATNPVFSFESGNTEIVSIDSTKGTFEALKPGVATIIVSMTCDETTTPVTAKTELVVNYGSITIQEALDIIEPLGSSETAPTTLSIRGYIVNLNGDNQKTGSERMIVLSDKKLGEEGGKTINVYGVYSSAAERKYMIINGEITVTGKPAKYNGSGQIASPSLSNYNDAAIDFAKEANTLLDPECAATDVKEETWNTIKAKYEALDSYAQAKLKAATSDYEHSDDIANFVARYTIIVRGYKYNDFMGTVNASRLTSVLNNNSSLTILSVMSIAALIGACLLIVKLKKSKHE